MVRDGGGVGASGAGAKLHETKAATLGGRWCQVDSMSELMHFLKLEKNYAEIMEHKWALFTAWSAKVDAGDNGAEVSPTMRSSASATKASEHDAKASTNAASPDDRAKQAPRTSAEEGKPVKRKTPNQCDNNGDDDEPKNKVSPLNRS